MITERGRGFSIRADDERFAIGAPLGTTRIEWAAVEGAFAEWPDNSVRFRLKPEYLARRGPVFRLGVWLGGRMYGSRGVRIDASSYGTTAEALAAALNERLAERVGQPSLRSPIDTDGKKTGEGPLLRYRRRFVWGAVGITLLVLLVERLLH